MNSPAVEPEHLHPALWRASQMARAYGRCIDTGHMALSAQLPGGGWPAGALVDLHLQLPWIREMRLLAPALRKVAARRIVLLSPPHTPQALALAVLGMQPSNVLWLRPTRSGDALWAAEQVLKSGSCGALLFWPGSGAMCGGGPRHVSGDSLRQLHLAAQHGETLFFIMRPLDERESPSPAPLRLALRAASGGLNIEFVKRQGPRRDETLFLPLPIGGRRHVQPQRHVEPAWPTRAPATTSMRELVQ